MTYRIAWLLVLVTMGLITSYEIAAPSIGWPTISDAARADPRVRWLVEAVFVGLVGWWLWHTR